MCSDRQENLRIAYQVAVDFVRSEEQGIWARFNAMLVANSITVAFIGAIFKSGGDRFIIPASLFGLLLCVMWYVLIQRGFAYRKYFVLSARELEACLQYPFEILTRGKKFSEGKDVAFFIPGVLKDESPYTLTYSCLPPERIAYFVIIAFAFLYLYMIFECPFLTIAILVGGIFVLSLFI